MTSCTCVRREMKVCHQGHGIVLGVTFIFCSDHLLTWHLLYDFLPLKTEDITLVIRLLESKDKCLCDINYKMCKCQEFHSH